MATGNARLEEVELELIARQKLRRHEIGLAQKAGTFDRAKYAKEMLAHYDALDRVLASKGWHSTSPWWREQVRRYFERWCRQVVLRVGRRGGKSSTLCRIAIVEGLYGGHSIHPGDVGVVAFISVKREEAAERMGTIKKMLATLGIVEKSAKNRLIAWRPIDGGIELTHTPIAFKVFTASISGVSGFTAICIIADEVSKWRDADTGANPATDVLASVRPTMATMPLAKIILSSSPMGKLDAHAAAYDLGDNDFQIVGFAQTWVANPSVTEEDTHALETDELRWRREYAAIPLEDTESGVYPSVLIDRATRKGSRNVPKEDGCEYLAATDPGFRGNAWTFAIATCRRFGEATKRSIVFTCQWRGTRTKPLNPDDVFREMRKHCEAYGVGAVYADQFSSDALCAIAYRHEIPYVVEPATSALNTAMYEGLSTRLSDNEIELPDDPQVRADLLGVIRRVTPNGIVIDLARTGDGRHCDYAPAVAKALFKYIEPPPMPPHVLTEAEVWTLEEQGHLKSAEDKLTRVQNPGDWWEQYA